VIRELHGGAAPLPVPLQEREQPSNCKRVPHCCRDCCQDPWPTTDAGRQTWNIGPDDGHLWTVLDDLPMPTDLVVAPVASPMCFAPER